MVASFSITSADKTATFTATGCSSVYWKCGDGSTVVGTSATHTYATYGKKDILIDYLEIGANGDRKTTTRSVTLTDPTQEPGELEGNTILDAFSTKPIIIPAECSGEISITASIQDTTSYNYDHNRIYSNDTAMGTNIGFYINFTSIELAGNSSLTFEVDKDTTTSTTFTGATVSDADMENVGNIPAFYNTGQLNIQYVTSATDSDEGEFDLKWDLFMSLPDAQTLCPWSEGNYATDGQIMKNLITSDNSEIQFPSVAEYSSFYHTFNIASWSQIPPFVIEEFVDEPATTIMVKRAMLADPHFHLRVTNNLSTAVSLTNIICKFSFAYDPHAIFMNMRTEGDKRKKRSYPLTLPKGAEVTRLESLDFPIYAVVDGYKMADAEHGPEIVKVYATWNEYYETGDYYFPTTIELQPVTGMDGTDYPTCLYKSIEGVIKRADFIRITDGGWITDSKTPDEIVVVDAPMIASSEHYRTINIRVQDDKSPDDQDAIFVIETVPNTSIDDSITEEELAANVESIHFFNKTIPFTASTTVARNQIDRMFYETLWQTYDNAAVLESIVDEPLYFINFSINDYPKVVPIRDGQTLSFSDSLSHAADGIRSGDIFYIDGKTPNVINIQCPTKHKYKVKFKVDYEVYKDVYIINDDDIPAGYL